MGQALDNDQYHAMLDSGTNAIIVPLQPDMQGEIAECQAQVPQSLVLLSKYTNLRVLDDWYWLGQIQLS